MSASHSHRGGLEVWIRIGRLDVWSRRGGAKVLSRSQKRNFRRIVEDDRSMESETYTWKQNVLKRGNMI